MKRWETILAIAGACLLALGILFVRRSALPKSDFVITAGPCHTPATLFEPPAGVNAVGSAILLHGLAANRRTMTFLGMDIAGHGFRTYLLDLPGHGDSRDGFTFAKAQECADLTVESLVQNGQAEPKTTILLGHSMGGAIAVHMADVEPVAATIAISPAPMAMPQRMPSNLLVFSGQFDLGVLKRQAQSLAAAAGGERIALWDFAEERAFELVVVPHGTHTSPLLDHDVAHRSEQWAMQALFPNIDSKTVALNLDLATYDTFRRGKLRLAGSVLGLLGLILLFPAGAMVAGRFGACVLEIPASGPMRPPYRLLLAEGAVCALIGTLILAGFIPLKFVRLYDGDYLASLLLISGALLLGLNWKCAKQNLPVSWGVLIISLVMGMAAILAVGGWANWQLSDLWLNEPRWLRFALLLPVTFLFCLAEESTLGMVGHGKRRALRFGIFLAMRFELWLACVLAYFMLASGEALIGILFPGLAAFSILQRLATDALRLRTGSAAGAAAFSAILASWFIAAVFPLT